MARQLTGLEPATQYRAVTFYKHSGAHGLPMYTYVDRDGKTYQYHRVSVFGPYEKPGPAKNMIKREERFVKQGYRNYYDFNLLPDQRVPYAVATTESLVEESTPIWGEFYYHG